MVDQEPGRFAAGTLALLVHAVFIGLLVFTVNWQSHAPQPIAVELWRNLPPLPQPNIQPAQRPEPKPEPVPEKAEPPKPEVEAAKPEIALKDKKADKRREEKKHKAEQEKLRQLALKESQEKAAEVRRQEEQMTLMRDMQAREAAAQARQVNDFKARINAKIRRYLNNQACLPLNNPKAAYDVTLMPTGQLLLDPKLVKSSGSTQCDAAIERAIRRAEPLPLPPDTALFSQFRELHLEFRPNDEN